MYGNNNYGGYPSYNVGSYYPGYTSPVYQQTTPQSVQTNTNKIYATGIEDVRSRQLPVNSDFIFLDNDKPLIYRKTTDSTGKMDVQVFKIVPYQEEEKIQPVVDLSGYVSIKDFERLEQQFIEFKQSFETPKITKKTLQEDKK
jgi:hypothetical protein